MKMEFNFDSDLTPRPIPVSTSAGSGALEPQPLELRGDLTVRGPGRRLLAHLRTNFIFKTSP